MENDGHAPLSGIWSSPHVFIKTLGHFQVTVHKQLATWKGGAAGARQLKRALAYLVAHRDRPVRREILIDVAGGRRSCRATYVIRGIRAMLQDWQMSEALTVEPATISLRRHPTWHTDTDLLETYYEQARDLRRSGRHREALQALQAAEPLCDGEYLPVLDGIPEHTPFGEMAYWSNLQKRVLRLLTCLCVRMPTLPVREQALRFAGRLISLDPYDLRSYRLAACVARKCGNEGLARMFEDRLHSI